jgi:hypothetical protein
MKNMLILFLFIIIISPYTNASSHNEKSYRKFFDETALYFSERIPVGTKVAVIGTSLNTSNSYSDYFIREMMQSLIGIDSLI